MAQVFSPPAKANGQLLREYQLDSAQLSHPCERFGATPSARNNFSRSAALVNKTFLSCSLHLHSPFKLRHRPCHIRFSLIPIYEPKHSVVHSFVDAPSTFSSLLYRAPFQLLLTPGGFRTRHNSEYPPSICGIFTKSIGSCPKANSFHQRHFWVHQLLDRERPQVHSRHFGQWSAAISGVDSTSSRRLYTNVICLQACHV